MAHLVCGTSSYYIYSTLVTLILSFQVKWLIQRKVWNQNYHMLVQTNLNNQGGTKSTGGTLMRWVLLLTSYILN